MNTVHNIRFEVIVDYVYGCLDESRQFDDILEAADLVDFTQNEYRLLARLCWSDRNPRVREWGLELWDSHSRDLREDHMILLLCVDSDADVRQSAFGCLSHFGEDIRARKALEIGLEDQEEFCRNMAAMILDQLEN